MLSSTNTLPTRHITLCLLFGLVGPVSALSIPRHFLQGKVRVPAFYGKKTQFPGCTFTGLCGTAESAHHGFRDPQERELTRREGYIAIPASRVPNTRTGSFRRAIVPPPFSSPVQKSVSRVPCKFQSAFPCYSLKAHDKELGQKFRSARQFGPFATSPPRKITVTYSIRGENITHAVDEAPSMNLNNVVTTVARYLAWRNAEPFEHYDVVREPDGDCDQRIVSVSGIVDPGWSLTVRDDDNQVLYHGDCYLGQMSVKRGYDILLSNTAPL